jgi:hypothetical protein
LDRSLFWTEVIGADNRCDEKKKKNLPRKTFGSLPTPRTEALRTKGAEGENVQEAGRHTSATARNFMANE